MSRPDHDTVMSDLARLQPTFSAEAQDPELTDPALIEPSPVVKPRIPTHDDLAALEAIPRDHVFVPIALVRGVAAFVITVAVGLAVFALVDAYDRLQSDPQSQMVLTVALVVMVITTLVALVFPRLYSAHLFANAANWEDTEADTADDWF